MNEEDADCDLDGRNLAGLFFDWVKLTRVLRCSLIGALTMVFGSVESVGGGGGVNRKDSFNENGKQIVFLLFPKLRWAGSSK